MKTSRAQFKLALRYCKANVEEMKANACAESLFDTDPKKFWNNVHKVSNSVTVGQLVYLMFVFHE